MRKLAGFTIIELLMVITVIGVLAGVTLAVIDSQGQQARAENGVKQANLGKAAKGVESFFQSEGFFPDGGIDDNPLAGADAALVAVYLSAWPSGAVYNYDDNISEFAVHIQKSTSEDFFKYRSTTATIDECDDTTPPNDVTACIPIQEGGGNPPPPNPTVTSVAVLPDSSSMIVGAKQQFTATATYSDGTTLDVTSSAAWKIVSEIGGGGATVNQGLVTATSAGPVTLSASYSGQSGTSVIKITDATQVVSLNVTPSKYTLNVGKTVQLTAMAIYNDGSSQNVTTTAVWTVISGVDFPAVTVNKGLVTAIKNGTSTVQATFSGKSDTSAITVTSGKPPPPK